MVQLLSYGRRTGRGVEGKICDMVQLLSYGRRTERGVEGRGRYNVTLCGYCLMAGEQREEWSGGEDIM